MVRESKMVLASGNSGKLRELRALLADTDIQVLPQAEFVPCEAEETGLSFVENALIKARHAALHSRLPAIADDSGIEVDCLNGEPGIHSARYAGADATDEANLLMLLENLRVCEDETITARFQCVLVFMRHATDPVPLIAQGTWEGHIVNTPRGENGFGYDPIFFVPDYACTSAELPPETKNRISHRALALHSLVKQLTGKEPG